MKRFLLLLAFLTLPACAPATAPADDRVDVAASFYPLAHFARLVGGDAVTVLQLTPPGVEPHDYEPTARDRIAAESADLLILNGAGFDTWVQRVADEMEGTGRVLVVTEGMALQPGSPHEEDEEAEEEEDHEDETLDPHVWLDPEKASTIIGSIRDALVAADAAHAEEYVRNAEQAQRDLSALDREFEEGLAECETRKIVVSHDAYGYLARKYDIETISVAGLSPDEEPAPSAIAEIIDLVRSEGLKHVFTETLASPALSQTIASEAGAETLVLNPLEGLTPTETANGENYLSIMRRNLDNLRTAMRCS